MGEHKHKKNFDKPGVVLEHGRTLSLPFLAAGFVLKFLLTILRLVSFPFVLYSVALGFLHTKIYARWPGR